jgi:hypothetical protein
MVEMARRIASAIALPVTVKTRIGWGPRVAHADRRSRAQARGRRRGRADDSLPHRGDGAPPARGLELGAAHTGGAGVASAKRHLNLLGPLTPALRPRLVRARTLAEALASLATP